MLDKLKHYYIIFLHRFVCHVETNNETDGSQILKSRLYTIRHLNFQTGVNTSYKYIVTPSDLATVCCALNIC